MDAAEGKRDGERQYVVLSRASADLYEDMVALFSAWPGIEVVVDRRHTPRSLCGFLEPIRLRVEEGRPSPTRV
jgi:hypothetical protein